MKYLLVVIVAFISFSIHAQKIEKDGVVYEVKDSKIFIENKEVTETLSEAEKTVIFKQATLKQEELKQLELEEERIKEAKKLEKAKRKAEKAQKKAENERKKAEKALKKQQKRQKQFQKAEANLNKANKKYNKLKRKGKLSPVQDQKWQDRIAKLSERLEKAKSRL